MDEQILIQGIQGTGIDVENGTDDIQGLLSLGKKVFNKAKKFTDVANKFGLLPPGTQFGLSTLESLTKLQEKTGKKVQLDVTAARDVYEAAFLKGYTAALNKVKAELEKMGDTRK